MLFNRSIPQATVIPELAYSNIGEAIEWLCEAFGFTLRLRIGDHRAQMHVGDGAVILIEASRDISLRSSVLVRIEDLDAQYRRACGKGVRILRPPTDYPYGERQYTAEDCAGHQWKFSQSISDVHPREWGGDLVHE